MLLYMREIKFRIKLSQMRAGCHLNFFNTAANTIPEFLTEQNNNISVFIQKVFIVI